MSIKYYEFTVNGEKYHYWNDSNKSSLEYHKKGIESDLKEVIKSGKEYGSIEYDFKEIGFEKI